MATESPIRMPGTSGKWSSLKEASTFAPPTSMVAEDLGLLLKGHKFRGSARASVPNRSGSAPPSMEGSFLAIGNLISQQNLNTDLESLNTAIANCESEEQLRADPAYLAYYCSNVNLNPRLPPPLISWENRRLVRHIGSFGNNWGLTSVDDKGNDSLYVPQGALSTHKEECEDDNTPQQPSDDQVDNSSRLWPVQNAASLPGDHKDLVGLLQEQLSSDPSSMYSQSYSLSHGVKKESFNHDAYSGSSNDSPVSTVILVPSVLGSDDRAMSSNSDHSAGSVSKSSSLHHTGSLPNTPPPQRGILDSADVYIQDELLITAVSDSHIPAIESEMKALNLSSPPYSGKQRNHEQWRPSYEKSSLQPQGHQQQINSFQYQNSKPQMPSQGGDPSFVDTDNYLYGASKFSAEQIQQSSGFTPPLFATAAAYMTSANALYPNHPAPFPPQYGVGGYPLNSNILPSYIAGYPQGTVPLVFDDSSAAGPSFHARTSDISVGGAFAHGGDTQHLNKLYGQLGYTVQPTFADPFCMAYYQQPFGEAYGMSGQLEPLAPRGGSIGNQVGPLNSQKGSDTISDKKIQHQRGGFMSNLNQQRGAMTGPNYFGNMSSMGIMQYPPPLHAGSIMPGSPISGTNLTRERKEIRFHETHSRSSSAYSGWQGQRGYGNFEDPIVYNFLEDLKSGKGKRFELSDIAGHIVEFSADQHGSRFIQQKLENCSDEDKASVFKEVLPHAPKLMTDVFGNYVIQKFFEYGSPDQRRQLANQLAGHILPLSLQMYGCRVIQKALEVIELEQKAHLIHELDGHVTRCVRDQNGNHVIQKCIESVAMEKIGFIISSFRGQVANLSMHPYGCRVVQRVLEHCTDELQCQFIVDEILESVCDLAQDQYGNYVTQHVLERGKSGERGQIINKFRGHIVQLSQHKFASNVVEKCLEYGGTAEREVMIQEIVGHNEGVDNLLVMMKDQYANYVVQKVLETCPDEQRVVLLGRIRVHVDALKKYTYGKHIAARFEQLYDYGENEAPGS